jgi:hypothetical protein
MTPKINQQDLENFEIIENLVRAITGMSLLEIPENNQEELIDECLNIFSKHVVDYVQVKYGKKEAIRLQAAQKFQTDSFAKFTHLDEKFKEAYLDFLDTLEKDQVTADHDLTKAKN